MDSKQAYSPEQLYETLISILDNVRLSEIAVSPYVLPEEGVTPPSPASLPSCSKQSVNKVVSHSIRPFSLIDGDKLVIPQKPLYAIYSYAVKALSRYPREIFHTTSSAAAAGIDSKGKSSGENDTLHRIDDFTKCILIQTPEHARAMNLRKRMLLSRLSKYIPGHAEVECVGKFIREELHLTELILGIASNAKMGPLWHHRKWLYALLHSLHSDEQNVADESGTSLLAHHMKGRKLLRVKPVALSLLEFQHELKLVDMCAERYPRNYQAWSYRYWLILGQVSSSRPHANQGIDKADAGGSGSSVASREKAAYPTLSREYETMEEHISTHITDYTAATHLLNIVQLSIQCSSWSAEQPSSTLLDRCFTSAVDFVSRYPYKETPWLLLRGVLALAREHQQSSIESASSSGIYQKYLQEALTLARSLAKTEGQGLKGAAELDKQREDWEERQRSSSFKYATRSLFYLSSWDDGVVKHPSLGSDEARQVLEGFR
ncbi:hypothetical protein P389DRAFT_207928 [Cystobasidium minutum MCA 4210]|uniref:uncharacterized protein n=1 Tax=Cystobasidium minutum MCA 4210 TaxID=1397322 RepID=UPI0034CD3648|eukprot:jgi/Rhomi1/207928/estExt_Genemark1.C_1_t20414